MFKSDEEELMSLLYELGSIEALTNNSFADEIVGSWKGGLMFTLEDFIDLVQRCLSVLVERVSDTNE